MLLTPDSVLFLTCDIDGDGALAAAESALLKSTHDPLALDVVATKGDPMDVEAALFLCLCPAMERCTRPLAVTLSLASVTPLVIDGLCKALCTCPSLHTLVMTVPTLTMANIFALREAAILGQSLLHRVEVTNGKAEWSLDKGVELILQQA